MYKCNKIALTALLVGLNITFLLLLEGGCPQLLPAEASTRTRKRVSYVTTQQLAGVLQTLTALKTDLEKTKQELRASKARLKDVPFGLSAAHAASQKADETGAALTAKLSAETTARQEDKATLDAEVATRKQDRATLDAEVAARQHDMATLREELTTLSALKGALEQEVAARKADRAALDAEIQARKTLLDHVNDLAKISQRHADLLNGTIAGNIFKIHLLQICDNNGKQQAQLGAGPDGKPALWLYDKDGSDLSTFGENIYLKLKPAQ